MPQCKVFGVITWSGWLLFAGLGSPARAEVPGFMQKPAPDHVRVLCYNINWDAIFEDGDPNNHAWRSYDKSDEFVRVVTALNPDIVCLQEINPDRDPQDVADILDAVLPLSDGSGWRAHGGYDAVIASRFDLSMLATDTIPTTNRGQAMALVDLPDGTYSVDLYLMNAHFKAGGSSSDISRRQQHADAIIHWIGDLQTPGGNIDVPTGTPVMVMGDLNIYDTDPHYHLTTLLTGDIVDEGTYGPDVAPDWDASDNTAAPTLHNGSGPADYTWRDDSGSFNPGPLDRIIYTDSALAVSNAFVLNTETMSAPDLAAAGLLADDVVLDIGIGYYDHLPLVVDVYVPGAVAGDFDGDGDVDLADYAGFVDCMAGPDAAPAPTPPTTVDACLSAFDADDDTDVDGVDFAAFQSGFTG